MRTVAHFVLLAYVTTSVFFLRWVYVCNKTVRKLGAIGLRHSPGMAVGSFFIPFANLVWPYEAMCDLWRASADAETWQKNKISLTFPFWWAFWLLNGAAGYGVFFLAKEAKTMDALRSLTIYVIGESVIGIVLTLLAIYIVRSVSDRLNRQIWANQSPEPTGREDGVGPLDAIN